LKGVVGKSKGDVRIIPKKSFIREGIVVTNTILRCDTPLDIPLVEIMNNNLKMIYGEIYLKGKNNHIFESALVKNIKSILTTEEFTKDIGMSYIKTNNSDNMIEKLRFIPGIVKIMQGDCVSTDFDSINKIIASIINATDKPVKFKMNVYLRRMKKWNNYSTMNLNYIFGQYIVDRFRDQVIVDLINPEISIYVDIRKKTTFISTKNIKATQGLPIGTEGKLLCVINENNLARSIVAVYRMLARGSVVHYMTDMENIKIITDVNDKMGCRVNIYPMSDFDEIKNRYYGIINEYPRMKNYGHSELRVTECESIEDINNILTRLDIYMHPIQIIEKKKVLLLLSGGIDSPVAAYKLLCSGYYVEFIHFGTHISKINNIKNILSIFKSTDEIKDNMGPLTFVEFKDFQDLIIKECPESYRTLMYKVYMIKIANNVAIKNGMDFIATGNSLGQVASQTPENIEICRRISQLLIISPLIGYNKDEVIEISKNIGTFQPSTCDGTEDVCVMYLPKNPIIRGEYKIVMQSLEKISEEKINHINMITIH